MGQPSFLRPNPAGELDLAIRVRYCRTLQSQFVCELADYRSISGTAPFVVKPTSKKPSKHALLSPEEAEHLIGELEQQAVQLEEQAADLETLNASLLASEARLQRIINAALDAIITTDADSKILQWNHHAEAIFGWSAEEAIGRNLNETIIPPEYREPHERGVRRYLATGEGPILNQRIEIVALHRDGTAFPVELTVAPIHWGNQVIFTSFIRDISDRKRAELQLAAQYAVTQVLATSGTARDAVPHILQAVCEHLGWDLGVFWTVDLRAGLLRPTHTWTTPSPGGRDFEHVSCSLTLASGEGLPGRVWESRQAAWIRDVSDDRNFPRQEVALQAGVHAGFAFPILVDDDLIGVMEFFQAAVAEPDEALLAAMAAMGSDIGQFIRRKAAEEQLRIQEETQRLFARVSTQLAAATPSYRDTLRSLAALALPALGDWCTIYAVDEAGMIERLEIAHADPAREPLAQELVQFPVDPNGPHPAMQVLRTGESVLLPDIPDELLAAVAENEEHLRILRQLGIRSGMVVPLVARGRTLGTITLVAAESGRRYTEQDLAIAQEFARRAALSVDNARLYAEAQQANRAKADFLATMSHELRTPLNAMIGYTDLMLSGVPEPLAPASEAYVKRVSLSAQHLLQLIEEILTFSRLEAGRETVTLVSTALSDLVDEVRAIIEPLAVEKGLRFLIRAPDEPIKLLTDPRKVRQILVNLLGNAVKFTEAGEIEFTAVADDGEVLLQVRDTGPGIEPGHLDNIFEPFWQVEQSATRSAQGTGLGLTVTQRLVSLLGGTLRVESTPGEGSVFAVRLPLRLQPDSAPQPS